MLGVMLCLGRGIVPDLVINVGVVGRKQVSDWDIMPSKGPESGFRALQSLSK